MKPIVVASVLGAFCAGCLLVAGLNDHGPGGADAASDAGADAPNSDGGSDAGSRCNPYAPFGAAVPVAGVLLDDVGSFRLTEDEKTAYYTTVARKLVRAAVLGPLELGTPVDVDVGFDGGIAKASMTNDGRILFFESGLRTYRAEGDGGGAYVVASPVDPEPRAEPYVDERYGWLYVVRYLKGFHREIMRAPLDAGNVVGSFRTLPLGPDSYHSPVAGLEAETLFLGRDGDGGLPLGTDIYFAKRIQFQAEFQRLDEPNSASSDTPMWISRDGCLLYFASQRQSGIGFKVYLTRRGN